MDIFDKSHIASLSFMIENGEIGTGQTEDEVEYELFRLAFQKRGSVSFDRANGGSFENLEQEVYDPNIMLLFMTDMIESIYRTNEEKNFQPYIVVGFSDIESTQEKSTSGGLEYVMRIHWRLIQDLDKSGTVQLPKGV